MVGWFEETAIERLTWRSQIASFACSDAKDRIWTFLVDFLEVFVQNRPKKNIWRNRGNKYLFPQACFSSPEGNRFIFSLFFFLLVPHPSATLQGPSTAMAGHGQLHPPGVDNRRLLCCCRCWWFSRCGHRSPPMSGLSPKIFLALMGGYRMRIELRFWWLGAYNVSI